MGRGALLAIVALAAGCNAKLPDPDSAGARIYSERCSVCHRLYAPTLLKAEMWKYQLTRKQGEMVRRGLPPLTAQEQSTLLAYLQEHAAK